MQHENVNAMRPKGGERVPPPIMLISSAIPKMTTLPPRLPIVLPTQGMTSGPSAPAMELGIAGNGAHDGPEESCLQEEPMDTAETPAASKRWGGFYFDQEQGQYPLE
jgi:hypothetical protein